MIDGTPLSPTAIAEKPARSPDIYLIYIGNEVDIISSGLPVAVMQRVFRSLLGHLRQIGI